MNVLGIAVKGAMDDDGTELNRLDRVMSADGHQGSSDKGNLNQVIDKSHFPKGINEPNICIGRGDFFKTAAGDGQASLLY